MKILHLAIQSPYNEGWGYQENLLPKYQVKLGHEVTLITSVMKNSENNSRVICEEEDYISPDGFRVIRRDYEHFKFKQLANLVKYYKVYDLLKEIKPDFIMVHGVNNISAIQVKRYLKKINPNCIVIADNHLDPNNCKTLVKNDLKSILFRSYWKLVNFILKDCYKKVYGVSPERSTILREVFKIDKEKIDLLPAGADDEKIKFKEKSTIRSIIREKNNISQEDFLIVTGGKIDENKKIDTLMSAVAKINNPQIKLLVFGESAEHIKSKIKTLAEHKSIRHIGWINSDDTYNYFMAADLVFFPGLHSVMWEQACATKTPCVFRRIKGFEHVNNGGNCDFLDLPSEECIIEKINELFFTEKYFDIKKKAESEKTDIFLYSNIAKKSLECAK